MEVVYDLWQNDILGVPCNRAVNQSRKSGLYSQVNHDVSNHLRYQKSWIILYAKRGL